MDNKLNEKEYNFLKHKYKEYLKMLKPFQQKCINEIESENNVLLCLNTGCGKTLIYLIWALKKILEKRSGKIIITAPTKALSDQRFRDLYIEGYSVGIETGDVKYNEENCIVLCCTQEIATYKYSKYDYITIIDEFHYTYTSPVRARNYIEYIVNSNCHNLLLCSATLGKLEKLETYFSRNLNKQFKLYYDDFRLTEIEYMQDIELDDIKNSYIVCSSSNHCLKIANKLKEHRRKTIKTEYMDMPNREIILKAATKYQIENQEIILNAFSGIACYFGKMLHCEQLFVTELLDLGIVDVICGTSALSLGVNFPIEKVIFVSVNEIDKNAFEQFIGRAGRYGLYDKGYSYYCQKLSQEKHLKEKYNELLTKENENIDIRINSDIGYIVNGKTTIEEELEFARKYSNVDIDIELCKKNIYHDIETIKSFFEYGIVAKCSTDIIKNYEKYFCKLYLSEFSALQNCILLKSVLLKKPMDQIISRICGRPTNDKLRKLLQIRKYFNRLESELKNDLDINYLDSIISNIDPTVLNLTLSFNSIADYKEAQVNFKEENENKVKEESTQIVVPNNTNQNMSIKEIYKGGTIVKPKTSSTPYIVLFHNKKSVVLLNYNAFKLNNALIITEIDDIKPYRIINKISDNDYKNLLKICIQEINSIEIKRGDISRIRKTLVKTIANTIY